MVFIPDSDKKTSDAKFDFPFKLHGMLEKAKEEGFDDIVSWLPDSSAFRILNIKEFSSLVVPKYFHIQYKSFIRQLNIYGFERDRDKKSPNYAAYSNPWFVRGDEDLCLRMSRRKIKGTGKRRRNIKTETSPQRRLPSACFSMQIAQPISTAAPLWEVLHQIEKELDKVDATILSFQASNQCHWFTSQDVPLPLNFSPFED